MRTPAPSGRRSRRRRARRSPRRISCSWWSTPRSGVTPGDEELAEILRSSRRPVLVLANKLDDPRRDLEALEFHRLGLGDPIPISAIHGHGTGDLLDEIVARLPGRAERPVGEEAISVAILGRPNVGKSSLLNALLGRRARDRLRGAGDDARRDRHGAPPRRDDLRPRRHGRPSPQAEAAPGNRVLLGAAALSRQPSEPTSRSFSSTRAKGWWIRT